MADRGDDPVHQKELRAGRHPTPHLCSVSKHDGAGDAGLLHDGLSAAQDETPGADATLAQSCQTSVWNPGVSLLRLG